MAAIIANCIKFTEARPTLSVNDRYADQIT